MKDEASKASVELSGAAGAATEEPQLSIVDHPEARRYEARLGDRVIGFSDYRRKPGVVIFIHTETDPAFAGRGVGRQLAAGALDDVRAHGLRVVAICPFIAAFICRHPEYADLLDTRPGATH